VELIQLPIKSAKRTIVIFTLALAGCRGTAPQARPTPEAISLRLVADNATAPLLRDLVNAYQSPGSLIAWNIQVGEVNTVLDWVQSDQASYGLLGFLPVETPDATLPAPHWMTPIGQRAVAFVVNPQNPLVGLSADQLRAILQGQVTNWSQIGGSTGPIHLIARGDQSGDGSLVQTIVLGARRTVRSARLATTSQAVIEAVKADANAIGYISMGYLDAGVRVLAIEGVMPTPEAVTAEKYPIRAPIVFIGKTEPADDPYRAFFAWVQSPAGQAIVRQKYGGLPAGIGQ